MNWLVLIGAFCISVVFAAWISARLRRGERNWTRRRRVVSAASVLPAFILVLTLAGIAWALVTGPGEGENMQDLAIFATLATGGLFAVLGLIGGILGALLGERSGGS